MVTNARDNGYAGAQSHTNNTAELSALLHALEWALESDYPRHEDDPLLLRYDSQYAANIMTGRWQPRANKALAGRLRRKWREASVKLRGQLWCTHVRGHSNHQWNDAADKLAKIGRDGRGASGTDRHGSARDAPTSPREERHDRASLLAGGRTV